MGNGKWGMGHGFGEWGMGIVKWEMENGNGKWERGNCVFGTWETMEHGIQDCTYVEHNVMESQGMFWTVLDWSRLDFRPG